MSSSASPCEQFIASILGTWTGTGTVQFPTMGTNTVGFLHDAVFAKPPMKTKQEFTMSSTTTRNAKNPAMGMHFDNGFLRCIDAESAVSWVLSHNSGNTEALVGKVQPGAKRAVFESQHSMGGIAGEPETVATKREISVDGNSMSQKFYMATKNVPQMTLHLVSELRKHH
jgi:hypothetical protein